VQFEAGFVKLLGRGQAGSLPNFALASAINQDAAHGLGGSGKKVSPVLPVLMISAEAQPSLMHERRGLRSLTGRLPGHPRRRQTPQFIINQRQQLFRRLRIPGASRVEDLGHLF